MIIIICAPSGTGKSTIINKFLEKYPQFKLGCSVTTRPKRVGEKEGNHYYFTTKEKFQQMKSEGLFFEVSEHFNNFYGSLKSEFEKKNIIFDVNYRGVKKIKNHYSCLSILFVPNKISTLGSRLRKRGDSEDQINLRSHGALQEINFLTSVCDHVIINNHVEDTLNHFINILRFHRVL